MNPVFGWGPECRFSWDTAKKILDAKGFTPDVDWPVEGEDDDMKVTNFFSVADDGERADELSGWFGRHVTEAVF